VQRLFLFLGFMAFGSGMIYLLAVQESPRRELEFSELPADVLIMEGVAIRLHEDAGLRFELFAREAVFNVRTGTTAMKSVRFKVYGDSPQGGWSVQMEGRAGKALMDKRKGIVELVDEVYIVEREGAEIRSGRIVYDQERERVVSPGEVWVKSRGATHRGSSLVYEIAQQKITLTAPRIFQ